MEEYGRLGVLSKTMRIIAILASRFVTLSIGFCLLPTLNAALIVYDGSDYEVGQSLEGNGYQEFSWGTNRWLKHYATSDWRVFSNSLSHPSVAPAGGHVAETNKSQGADYERRFAPVVFHDGDSIWFSFLVKVTQGASWDLYLTSAGLNSNQFGVQGNYPDYNINARVGVGYNGSTETINLGQNSTRLIVGRYRYSAVAEEQLDLWVDPDITRQPQPGGVSSSNHIVHLRHHDLQPAGIDSVLLENRSLGSLAFDELRVGTTWKDVVPSAVDRVVIDAIAVNGSLIDLQMSKLSPGTPPTVDRTTRLSGPPTWDVVAQFGPLTSSTNWTQSTTDKSGFYRVRLPAEPAPRICASE
jgi:hypothetical protein